MFAGLVELVRKKIIEFNYFDFLDSSCSHFHLEFKFDLVQYNLSSLDCINFLFFPLENMFNEL